MTLLSHNENARAFQELLEKQYKQSIEPGPMQKAKDKAWSHFLHLGLPSRQNEVYRYIHLRQLFGQAYTLSQPTTLSLIKIAPHILPECRNALLVFVNGHYQPSLSNTNALPKTVGISTLADATRIYGAFLNNQWAKLTKEEADPFAVLNAALHRNGIFIYIPPKMVCETPIQILNIIDTAESHTLVFPRLHLFAGARSEVSIATTSAQLSKNGYCLNQTAELAIEEEAHVRYTQVACAQPADVWHFDALRATLKQNSSLKTVAVTDGSTTVRHDYRAVLAGQNAEARLNGLWMLSNKREAHTHVLMDHQAPHCRSMQLFKGVLNDLSRSSFEGKILVQQAAQKTEAFQLNNNLILSDRAHADSKPNLEIFADDVKASHGATVGRLDDEQLFYMKARGFSEADAKNMLISSFCKEIIDLIDIPSLQKRVGQIAKSYMAKERLDAHA